jgi:carboxyl-terminal processing protease
LIGHYSKIFNVLLPGVIMRLLVFVVVWSLWLFLSAGFASTKAKPLEYDSGRNRLIAYMLSHQLPAQHFDHKALDDELSKAAFDLYLRLLDPRKRFFLEKDIKELGVFTNKIDDELRRGLIVLPDAAATVFNDRVVDVQGIIDQIMDAGFNPDQEDYLELDPEKINYVNTIGDLKERWRRILKMQAINDYLDLLEEQIKKSESSTQDNLLPDKLVVDKELWQKSMKKIRERNHRYLKRLIETSRQEQYNRYFDVVARAFDPHTNYMPPTSKEDFDIHMRGSLEGIGALLREDDGYIKVVSIIPGSAAERQGRLMAEDIILAVSEKAGEPVDMFDMRIREAVSYIRGPKGTEVRLTIQKPDGLKVVIPIIRDVVQIEETYVKSELLDD